MARWAGLTSALRNQASYAHLFAAAVVVLGLYALANRLLLAKVAGTVESYGSPSILAAALVEPVVWHALVVVGLLPMLSVRRITWDELGITRLRWVFCGVAIVLAWAYSTYDYNHYLGRWHVADRLALVCLTALMIWRPGFVGLFLIAVTVVAQQFRVPLLSYTWTDKRILFQLLGLFSVFLSVRLVWRINARVLVVLVFSAHAVSYLVPAHGKMLLPWLERDNLSHLWIAFQTNGWLDQLTDDTTQTVAEWVALLNGPTLWATMIVELLPCFLLVERRLAIGILAACVGMHLMIFASSGIFFWKWIVLGALLIALCTGRDLAEGFFGWRHGYLALFLLALYPSALVMKPVRLAWLDTRLNNMYELEVEDDSGRVDRLGRDQMSPFDVIFSQNRFSYLVPFRHFPMTGGTTTNVKLFDALERLETPEAVTRYQRKRGRQVLSERKRSRFADFVCRYFQDVNRVGGKRIVRWLAAPKHISMWRSGRTFDWKRPVRSVRVRWLSTWYDGRSVHTIENREIARFIVEGPADRSTEVWTHVCSR